MIMTVAELRTYITTDKTDAYLKAKLQSIEKKIRKHTNNNFQVRAFRVRADIADGTVYADGIPPFVEGDTVQVSESMFNAGLFTVDTITDTTFTVKESLYSENDILVTKVVYEEDVKEGVANLMQWELDNRSKVGIQSETISRHSVTYFNMDGDNSLMGYPKSLMGFLKPYMKARF